MRFAATMLFAILVAAACSSNQYGPCTLGEGKPPCPTCQCAAGSWQAVDCPAHLPGRGDACSPDGAYCGYETDTNECGAANCYCQHGTWNCEPTCIIVDASSAPDVSQPSEAGIVEAGTPDSGPDADSGAEGGDASIEDGSAD